MPTRGVRWSCAFVLAFLSRAPLPGQPPPTAASWKAGCARADITPETPVRLSGYGARRTESEGVEQKLQVKALALQWGTEAPAVLLAVDATGVPAAVAEEVAGRLKAEEGLPRERLAVTCTHTHTAPLLGSNLGNLFGEEIPDDQKARIAAYTRLVVERMVAAARAALAARAPARLVRAQGRVGFAKNRRTAGGPVDHDLPVLAALGEDGKVTAVAASYACHCTTLGPEFNKCCGDWAGYAQEAVEAAFPGATALVTIGCGADANPEPRTGLEHARRHGAAIGDEVRRLLSGGPAPVPGPLAASLRRLELPFDRLPSREEWEERAKKPGAFGRHAKLNLARLDRGEALPATLPCPVQTWVLAEDLAMVFLAGEVVVDYALRLKTELDPARLWVTAYANDVPCYIPSERVLREGGYEAEGAMVYYDQPGRLLPAVENLIVRAVREQVPAAFLTAKGRASVPTEGVPPRTPEEARVAIRLPPGLLVELAASEPLIESPVAIDFAPDGRLFVVEMRDYPSGIDGQGARGGRVKLLADRDGDGVFDAATVFLDDIPFPTGVLAWGKGALVCAAPDIIQAEDADGDGVAEDWRVVVSGFETHNFQARVNGLSLGLDNRIHGAAGLFGGVVRGPGGREADLRDRDFRLNPRNWQIEPETGRTQQGRVRDDSGDWFGGDSGCFGRHYPLPARLLARVPELAPPPLAVDLARPEEANRVFPVSMPLVRFNQPQELNRVTAACGVAIHRDTALGDAYAGSLFVCEPVGNLVHRRVLTARCATFEGRRAPGEEESEFLASSDPWFRPVQVKTGPDGALWVVDMARFVIEHPRWITPERLAALDVRAGAERGRIWRVVPADRKLPPAPRLDRLGSEALAAALDTPNGALRDLVHMMIRTRTGDFAFDVVERIAREGKSPAARAQALAILDGEDRLDTGLAASALADPHPVVRRAAVRAFESRPDAAASAKTVLPADDPDPKVRLQVAITLAAWADPPPATVASMLVADAGDPWIAFAALAAASKCAPAVLDLLLAREKESALPAGIVDRVVQLCGARRDASAARAILAAAVERGDAATEPVRWARLAAVAEGLAGRGASLPELVKASGGGADALLEALPGLLDRARCAAARSDNPAGDRARAARLLDARLGDDPGDPELLVSLLGAAEPGELQDAALATLGRRADAAVATAILAAWDRLAPARRLGALDVLLGRPAWTEAFLDAAARTPALLGTLDAARRESLLRHAVPAIRERAAKLFRARTASRQAVIDARRKALGLPGDAARGREVFARTCAACHRHDGGGTELGPDVFALTDRSPEALLVSILDPNRERIEPFVASAVTLRDGRTLVGLIRDETKDSFVLLGLDGRRHAILRAQVASLVSSGRSLMPDGLEDDIDDQSLADLFAFIRGR